MKVSELIEDEPRASQGNGDAPIAPDAKLRHPKPRKPQGARKPTGIVMGCRFRRSQTRQGCRRIR